MTTIRLKIPVLVDLMFVWPALLYRLLRYGWAYRKIPLGEGRWTIVDPLIYYWLNSYHWTSDARGECIYAIRHKVSRKGRSTIVRMHREIMNAPAGLLVDHRNNNTLDNRRENLRLATQSQNMQNRRKCRTKATSQFIGVFFDKNCGKWRAKIGHQGKYIYLGIFDNELDAVKAYDAAARKYYGEFARLNFPEEAYI
ncbi:MAG: HNH endonuclease [Planctomycetota bacterium]